MAERRSVSYRVPPSWSPMQAVWSRKLKCWHLHDCYHRVPLVPVPCKTLTAIFRIAGDRLSTYLENPVVGPDGEWLDAEECISPHSTRCVHGLLLRHWEGRWEMRAENGSVTILFEPHAGANVAACLQEAQGLAWKHGVVVIVKHNARTFHLKPFADVPAEEIE